MKCGNRIICCALCFLLLLSFQVQASEGEAVPRENGQSDVMAGVFVDYMEKLQFRILEEKTEIPISGVSVELYIPSLDRYVLTGITDDDGSLLLDVAQNMVQSGVEEQIPTERGRQISGEPVLHTAGRRISYQIYKNEWLPYPKQGSTVLENTGTPQSITEHLYREVKESGGSGGGGSHGGGGSSGRPKIPPTEAPAVPTPEPEESKIAGIPKTGVEGTMQYWLMGLVLFTGAGLLLWRLWKKEENDR